MENVVATAEEWLSFLGFEMHPRVMKFIEQHTIAPSKKQTKNPYSTVRNSTNAAMNWKKKLPFGKILQIQSSCASAMQLWGYKMAISASELQNLTPYLTRDEYDVGKVIRL